MPSVQIQKMDLTNCKGAFLSKINERKNGVNNFYNFENDDMYNNDNYIEIKRLQIAHFSTTILCNDLWRKIFLLLYPKETKTLRCVCKHFNQPVNGKYFYLNKHVISLTEN